MDKLKLSPKLAMTAALSAIVGGLAVQQSASAMQIGEGRIDINLVGAVEVTGNTVNFLNLNPGAADDDLYDIPVNEGGDAVARGNFDVTVATGAFADLGFDTTAVAGNFINDIVPTVPPPFTTDPTPDFIDAPARNGAAGDLVFEFDNGFEYYYTSITRTTTPFGGGFINNFSFNGFFRDTTGTFDDTFSEISLFTAATDIDITSIPSTPGTTVQEVLDNFNADVPGTPEELAAINGVITTVDSIPEPGTVLGLLAIGGLGLGLKKKKQS